ncbi:MAG: diguanylate cyclase [Candidatus Margulisiibacteriota bacterium]
MLNDRLSTAITATASSPFIRIMDIDACFAQAAFTLNPRSVRVYYFDVIHGALIGQAGFERCDGAVFRKTEDLSANCPSALTQLAKAELVGGQLRDRLVEDEKSVVWVRESQFKGQRVVYELNFDSPFQSRENAIILEDLAERCGRVRMDLMRLQMEAIKHTLFSDLIRARLDLFCIFRAVSNALLGIVFHPAMPPSEVSVMFFDEAAGAFIMGSRYKGEGSTTGLIAEEQGTHNGLRVRYVDEKENGKAADPEAAGSQSAGVGIAWKVIEEGIPLCLNRKAEFEAISGVRWRKNSGTDSYGSLMAVPLLVQGKIVGVIFVKNEREDAFSLPDLIFLQDASEEIGNALSSAHAYQEFRRLARLDPMLGVHGILSKRYVKDDLAARVREAQARGNRILLLFADIDNFGATDRAFDHVMADDVLHEISQRMVVVKARAEDDIYRYGGGEEFVWVLEVPASVSLDEQEAAALKICRRIRRSVGRQLISICSEFATPVEAEAKLAGIKDRLRHRENIGAGCTVDQLPHKPEIGREGRSALRFRIRKTLSVGATLIREGEDPITAIQRANEAEHQAKEGGRNQEFFLL